MRNLQAIAQTASQTGAVMELLLAGVAAVSLVVGGIGIMNIMLVSVTERTREIGLRMAVGARAARSCDSSSPKRSSSATIGGVIGVVAGGIGTLAVALLTHWPTAIPLQWVVASVAFSALVGIFFGYYPARQAAAAQSDRGAAIRVSARIAVIDDEPNIRHLLTLALGHRGFAVRCAADGSAGARARARMARPI